MKKTILFMILSAAAVISCSSDKQPGPADATAGAKEIGVVIESDAAVRIHPYIYTARVAVMSTGDYVEILDKSKEQSRIAGKLDYWYKVRLRSGITGWIYGTNLKIFTEGQDSSVESYAKELREEEASKIMKDLKGKYWSVTDSETFTDSILALWDDGKYASFIKGSETPIEGEYTVDTLTSAITFDKGSTVGDSINYIIRGDMYVLEVVKDGKRTRFKKISSDPSFKKDVTEVQEAEKKAE
ncbi:MAG: SH3 domain-containing protein [Spirochaetota bacterium]